MSNTLIAAVFLLTMFLLYDLLIFEFLDTILENQRIKNTPRFFISLCNIPILGYLVLSPLGYSFGAYLIFWFILFIECCLFYKDKLLRYYFCAAACALHVMCMRAMSTAVFSFFTGKSIYIIANSSIYLLLSVGVTFAVLDVCVLCVIKFIPGSEIKIINQHRGQLWFMCGWITIFNLYLLINSLVYSRSLDHPDLTGNQFFAPLAILIGLYVVLFFAIQTGKLLGFKEKSHELQKKIQDEKQYRNSVTSDALMAYEFNLSDNRMLSGFNEYAEELGARINSYSSVLDFMKKELVHPDDSGDFIKYLQSDFLLTELGRDKTEIVFEYRQKMPANSFGWVRAVTNLVKEPSTGAIKGFTYIKNIDAEKKRQLELQFKAERDSLTGLYNREMTEKLVAESLLASRSGGALYIIDIDNFKAVNDHFGHTFGDAVLCEFAEKLKKLFRTGDICGRIGGDEFIAYLQGVINRRVIETKAQEICKLLHEGSFSDLKKKHAVSGSVGIALYPCDGGTFDQLYKNADVSLYMAKNKGKDTYQFYDGSEFAGYESTRTEIESSAGTQLKSFKMNKTEYVFKILYDSENPLTAIQSVLELIAGHFNFDRGCIFEISRNGGTITNTFEWYTPEISAQMEGFQNIPVETYAEILELLKTNGDLIINGADSISDRERAFLDLRKAQSVFQYGIFDKTNLIGFISFENCRANRVFEAAKLDEIKNICGILATFFASRRCIDSAGFKAS